MHLCSHVCECPIDHDKMMPWVKKSYYFFDSMKHDKMDERSSFDMEGSVYKKLAKEYNNRE